MSKRRPARSLRYAPDILEVHRRRSVCRRIGGGDGIAAAAAVAEPLESRRLFSLAPAGGEFLVNQVISQQQRDPAVAVDARGDLVVVWASNGNTGAGANQDASGLGVYARRYDAAGTPLGGEFRVNTYTTGDQSQPAVAVDADGDFIVTWTSLGQEGDVGGVYAQRYTAAGVPRGGEFRVNTTTAGLQ